MVKYSPVLQGGGGGGGFEPLAYTLSFMSVATTDIELHEFNETIMDKCTFLPSAGECLAAVSLNISERQ